jgi:hypothetical protein
MIRIRMEDFKEMYSDRNYNSLYHALLQVARAEDGEVIRLNVDSLKEAFKIQWNEFVRSNPGKILRTEQPAASAPYTPADEPQVGVTEQELSAGRTIDEQAAVDRMRHWSQFLVDDAHNIELLRGHIVKEFGGRLSGPAIDASVAANKAALHWKAPVVSKPAPPPPPPPRKLQDGSDELPLNATESQMKAASVLQLRDLDSRRRNNGQKFVPVTRGSDSSRQLMMPKHEFPPLPAIVTRKVLLTCSREQFEAYRMRHGDANIDARLQNCG